MIKPIIVFCLAVLSLFTVAFFWVVYSPAEQMTPEERIAKFSELKVQEKALAKEIQDLKATIESLKYEVQTIKTRQYLVVETLMLYVRNNEALIQRRLDEYIGNSIEDRQGIREAIRDTEEKETIDSKKE